MDYVLDTYIKNKQAKVLTKRSNNSKNIRKVRNAWKLCIVVDIHNSKMRVYIRNVDVVRNVPALFR